MGYRIVVVGATGNVGREMLTYLMNASSPLMLLKYLQADGH